MMWSRFVQYDTYDDSTILLNYHFESELQLNAWAGMKSEEMQQQREWWGSLFNESRSIPSFRLPSSSSVAAQFHL